MKFEMKFDKIRLSGELEESMEWHHWSNEIPFIKFDSDWEVKIIPPFAGAVVRFLVKKNDKQVSIYLDCYDILGYHNSPYWEVYPVKFEGYTDTARFNINDISGLLLCIREELK